MPGTKGKYCEVNEDDCYENACYHGGVCKDGIGGYVCECPPGYVGHQCEGDVNECLSSPCHSEGTEQCIQKVNDYKCVCRAGYTGLLIHKY